MDSAIIAAVITGGAVVVGAWIDRDRFRHRRHVESNELQRLDNIIVAQRKLMHRQALEIRNLRKYVDSANRNGYGS